MIICIFPQKLLILRHAFLLCNTSEFILNQWLYYYSIHILSLCMTHVCGCRHTCGWEQEHNFSVSLLLQVVSENRAWHIARAPNSWNVSRATLVFDFFLKFKCDRERQKYKNSKTESGMSLSGRVFAQHKQSLDSSSSTAGERGKDWIQPLNWFPRLLFTLDLKTKETL